MTQVPKNRIDLLPHYSRLIATLNRYMPDVGADLVAAVCVPICLSKKFSLLLQLDEEFRYLQRKKNVVKELSETRLKVSSSLPLPNETHLTASSPQNISFLSSLTKFGVVPPHVILHMFKVCLDDFSGTNVENIALLLEGCGRFLLRSEETQQPFSKMVRGTCL